MTLNCPLVLNNLKIDLETGISYAQEMRYKKWKVEIPDFVEGIENIPTRGWRFDQEAISFQGKNNSTNSIDVVHPVFGRRTLLVDGLVPLFNTMNVVNGVILDELCFVYISNKLALIPINHPIYIQTKAGNDPRRIDYLPYSLTADGSVYIGKKWILKYPDYKGFEEALEFVPRHCFVKKTSYTHHTYTVHKGYISKPPREIIGTRTASWNRPGIFGKICLDNEPKQFEWIDNAPDSNFPVINGKIFGKMEYELQEKYIKVDRWIINTYMIANRGTGLGLLIDGVVYSI